MKNFKFYSVFCLLVLFLTGTAIQAQETNRFGFLDEFDDDVISGFWQDYDSKYNFVEEDGKLKTTVDLAANSWNSFGLELPVPIDVTGALLQLRIKSDTSFNMMVKPEDKDGNADGWPHPTFAVDSSGDYLLYTFDFDANYGGEDTYDAENVKKIYFFFDPQKDFDGKVEFEYVAIGSLAKYADMPYSGFLDNFDDDVLVMDEPWSDYGETSYTLTEENGILSIACNTSASWKSFGLKFMDTPVDLKENPVIRLRMKSDKDFPMTIKFKDKDGKWDQWGTWGHPVFDVDSTVYFKTYTFDIGATMEPGVDVYDLERIEEISFYFNANEAFACNVEFDWYSMGSYNDEALGQVSGFYDGFSDDVLIMDEPWSDYGAADYVLTEEDDLLKIACNTSGSWKSFGLKFMEYPLDLSENPVIKLKMRSDKDFPMTIKFKDAEGNWDQWGTWGHPVFDVDSTDFFKTYTFDIGATIEAGHDTFDLSMIQEIAFYFNANEAFACNVEFDWFSLGNTNPVSNRLQTSLGQNYFANGINLAWLEYGGKELTTFSTYEPQFVQALDSIALSGGNVLRWWLHTHTLNTPEFNGEGKCSGIQEEALDAIKRALDLAAERRIMVDLCLWTHNLLKTNAGEANYERNFKLISDEVYTQAYIDNALVPMVEHVKGHSALLCWEIVNEPELLTGGHPDAPPEYVPTKEDIQRFINLQAGAIHRADPSAAVSVGALSFNTCQTGSNWYEDDTLIDKGGDPDGILDFYMGHYYGFGPNPFTNSPTDLGIDDKPVVIGEFSDLDEGGNPVTGVTSVEDAYLAAYDMGYAGVMAWKYFETPGDNTGNFTHHKPGIEAIYKNYPDDVILISGDINSSPYAKKIIPLLLAWPDENAWDSLDYVRLDTIFFDKEDGGLLTYTVDKNTNPSVVTATIQGDYTLDLSFPENAMGETYITIKAEDSGGKTATITFRIYIIDERNKALGAPVKVSSVEGASKLGSNALDGDPTTRFATLLGVSGSDDEWFFVDLGQDYVIDSVVIDWEAAYGKQYTVYYAAEEDSTTTYKFLQDETIASFVPGSWTSAFTEASGDGEKDMITFDTPFEARYIGFQGAERFNSEWGYSMWEFQVFGHIMSTDATLAELVASAGVLDPVFDPGVTTYSLTLPVGSTSVDITATPNDANADVSGDGNIDVSSGSGTATIVVTAEDGTTTKTYTVNITVSTLSDDATLASLNVSAGTLDPAFDAAVTSYSLELPVGSVSVDITATVNDANASLTGDGTIDVSGGSATANIVVTAEDGISTKTYTVDITVKTLSTDATLDTLVVSAGNLNPLFDPAETVYTLNLPPGTNSVDITATANDANATVSGDGTIDVSSGSGTATLVVTAEDGTTTKTYTVNITVTSLSNDATLSNLVTSVGTLVPVFSPAVTSYSLSLPEGTTSVDLTATVNDTNASKTGDGTIDVSGGGTTVDILVTAEDGVSTTTYSVMITIVGINTLSDAGIMMYPNPASTSVILKGIAAGTTLRVIDILGQIVFNAIVQDAYMELDVSGYSKGIYLINIEIDETYYFSRLIIE